MGKNPCISFRSATTMLAHPNDIASSKALHLERSLRRLFNLSLLNETFFCAIDHLCPNGSLN